MLAVLGLTAPGNGDWNRLRGLQYAQLAEARKSRLLIQGIGAFASAGMLIGQINVFLILGWLAAVAGTLHYSTKVDVSLADADHRRISEFEVRQQSLGSIYNALAWIVPIAIFGPFVEVTTQLKLWTVGAMLMTASAVLLPSVPMGTLLFIGVVGAGSVIGLLLNAQFDIAVLACAFLGTVSFGAATSAHRFLSAKIAEACESEKNEVVSMLLREFEEGEADWLWQIDPSRRVRAASPRFAYALGMDPKDIDGKPFIQLIAGPAWETGQFPPSLYELTERLKNRESFSNMLVRVLINGQQRWWELSGTPKLNDKGVFDGFRGVGSDVTERQESDDKIAWMARYDTLTGLPNRMMLTEALDAALQHSAQWRSRCAFLMIDLDRFKAVNDSLGHLVGDRLLQQVAKRLQEQMTDNELCGRLGGDEFAIVIREASDPERVDHVAQRIIHRLSQPYDVDNHTLYVGASVGSAVGPRDGSSVETLMRNADLALYRSKETGGGSHFTYEPSLHAHAEERRKLEFSLRHAIARDELVLHYQPVVDARSEDILSFEALLRWNSADHGFVSPAKFIPLAEETRLIVPIGEWVLREACKEAARWPSNVHIAVNVSGEQLLDDGFAATVVSALASTGLSPQRLDIEVTESIFLRDATLARTALEQIRALGCGISLDDFGTGYSSLGYLRKIRFSNIKVDRSFVQGAATGNPESLAIIRAVVAMADSLDMSTTAEGVESAQELEVVRELGCKKIQGYYYGRPMEAQAAMGLFQRTIDNKLQGGSGIAAA